MINRTLALTVLAFAGGFASIAIAAAPVARPDLDPADVDRIAAIVQPTTDFSRPENFEANSGGATTVVRLDRNAFSQPAANLDFQQFADFSIGDALFRKLWVSAPSSTTASDGLGPLFNARGCQECHIKDGRGHPPLPGAPDAVSFLLGLSPPHGTENFAFGVQLQEFGVPGAASEGRVGVTYTEQPVALAGGETASLRIPSYIVAEGGFGPLPEGTLISPRVAPQMIGLGLIEAIHPNDILAGADPDDSNHDGISGRIHWVTDIATGEPAIGRCGWKAAQPSIADQTATAFAMDMGLSSALVRLPYGDCGDAQPECRAMANGNAPDDGWEVAPELFDAVLFYARHLAVPARRDPGDPTVLAGKALFYESGCTGCHTPKYVTSNDPAVPDALRRQLIWPYTDLLLHDMGPGLADNRPQGDASGSEWRTAPLWGIGLTGTVNGDEAGFLHDGRARTLLEAVLWHGGEAQPARDAVVAMTPEQRAALVRFLESL
jgi:CxxC motif-containing protein (DUF1111 family)